MKIEFEWKISSLTPHGNVYVTERLCGHDAINTYGPMPIWAAEGFVRARRDIVHRNATTRLSALKIFGENREKREKP